VIYDERKALIPKLRMEAVKGAIQRPPPQPVFLGIRMDKNASEVIRERAS
jgi:hypothetical protein